MCAVIDLGQSRIARETVDAFAPNLPCNPYPTLKEITTKGLCRLATIAI